MLHPAQTGREGNGCSFFARKLDVQIVLEGTVRQDNNLPHITSWIVDVADGFQVWSERVDTEPDPQGLARVSERIASSFLSLIRPGAMFYSVGLELSSDVVANPTQLPRMLP
jgi:TolB-like protein